MILLGNYSIHSEMFKYEERAEYQRKIAKQAFKESGAHDAMKAAKDFYGYILITDAPAPKAVYGGRLYKVTHFVKEPVRSFDAKFKILSDGRLKAL